MKDLYDLIQTLSGKEKGDFKKMANRQKGEKSFVRIFDVYAKTKFYDKELIKSKFKSEPLVKSLHVYENYCYNQVLQSLISTSKKHFAGLRINQLIIAADILESKGLYGQAEKQLTRAKKDAKKYHKTLPLLSILERLITLSVAKEVRNRKQRIKSLFQEAEIVRKSLDDEWVLSGLYRSVFNIYRELGNKALVDYPEIIENAAQHPLITNDNSELTFYATYFKSSLLGLIAKVKKDRNSMTKHYELLLYLWQNNPHIIKEKPHSYRIILANYMSNCSDLEQWDKVRSILSEMKKLPARDFNDEAENFQTTSFAELYYLINTGSFQKAEKLVPEIEFGLEKYKEKINEARRINIMFLVTLVFFINENFDEGMSWNNKILSIPKLHQHKLNVKNFCRVLEVLIHYELGNIDYLDARIRAVIRYFDQNKEKNKLNLLILNYIKKLINAADKKPIFIEFETRLKNWNSDFTQPTGLEEVTYWVKAKIQKTTMARLLEKELKKP